MACDRRDSLLYRKARWLSKGFIIATALPFVVFVQTIGFLCGAVTS